MMERADQALHDAKVISRERRLGDTPQPAEPSDAIERDGARVRPVYGVPKATEAIGQSDPVWSFAALPLGLTGLVLAVVSIGGMVQPLTPLAGGAIATGLMAFALTCVWAVKSGPSGKWLHLPWAGAYGLIALAILLAGQSGTALLDLLPAIGLYGFLLFKARMAAFYLILGQALYGGFAIGGGFAQGVGRTVISVVVVAVIAGLIAKLRLVTVRLARTNRELSELDALTGVGNIRALHGRVLDAVERATSKQLHPVIVAIDLDEFKPVNDAHSHSTGDRVLIAVARAVSERVRIDELVARRGGDEFMVLINDADPQYAEAVAQRVGHAIMRARSRICPDLRPTASVASVLWQAGETPDDFLHRADIALRDKKAQTRQLPTVAEIAEDPGGHDTLTDAITTQASPVISAPKRSSRRARASRSTPAQSS